MHALLLIQSWDDEALAEAAEGGADALVLDLATGESERAGTRKMASKALLKLRQAAPSLRIHVRIAGLTNADEDLDAVMPAYPSGILLGATKNGADLQKLSVKLSVREAALGLAHGTTKIIAAVATSPASVFELGSLAGKTHRLTGLVCGEDGLVDALGGSPAAAPIATAKHLTLLAANAAGVAAIATAAPRGINDTDLRALCEAAKRDGFHGMLATDRKQLAIINSVFKGQEPNR